MKITWTTCHHTLFLYILCLVHLIFLTLKKSLQDKHCCTAYQLATAKSFNVTAGGLSIQVTIETYIRELGRLMVVTLNTCSPYTGGHIGRFDCICSWDPGVI